MVILNDTNRTVIDGKVAVEAMSLNLSERGSTASLTPRDMSGLGMGKWLRDETEPGEGIVWRVRRVQTKYDSDTAVLELEHIVNTFKDYCMGGEVNPEVITGRAGATTCTALEAVQFILRHQPDWVLDQFSYGNVSNGYDLSCMDLFSALERVTSTLEDPIWTYDTTSYPFKLSITTKSAVITSELRAGRNIRTISRTVDRSAMYTRIWPYGKDWLMVDEPHYVENNVELYGLIEHVETDTSIESKDELLAWATQKVNKHSVPQITIAVEGLELSDATGESLDKFRLGQNCRIPLAEFGQEFTERIVSLSYPDKIYQPDIVKITLSNQFSEVTKIISELARTVSRSNRSAARSGAKVQSGALNKITLTQATAENNWQYTLHLFNLDKTESEWTKLNQITFSRAVTGIEGTWSGNHYYVTVSPTGQTGGDTYVYADGPTWGTGADANKATVYCYYINSDNVHVNILEKVVNAQPRYNAGWGNARASVTGQTYTVGGKTYNVFPTTAQTDPLTYIKVSAPNETVDGSRVDFNYYLTSENNDVYIKYGSAGGVIVATQHHGKYDDGWMAAAGSVDLPNAESSNTGILIHYPANDRSQIGTTLSKNYTLAHDGNNAVKLFTTKVVDGQTTYPAVAKFTHGKYDDGWMAAAAKVTLPDTESSSTGILINYPANDRNQIGTRLSKNYTLANDGNNAVKLFTTKVVDGTTTFPTVAIITHGKYDDGWMAAAAKVGLPESGSGTGILIGYPANDRNQIGTQLSKNYTLALDGNNAVKLFTTKVESGTTTFPTVATITHGKYDDGWMAAAAKVTLPESGSGTGILINYPANDRSQIGTQLSKNYTLANDGNNAVKLFTTKVESGTTTFPTVATFTHGKYDDGWMAAAGNVTLPNTESSNTGIAINYPANSRSSIGTQLTKNYTLANDGDNAVKLFTTKVESGQTTFPAVAKFTHGKYTAGYNAGVQAGADAIVFMTCDDNANRIVNNYNVKMYDASGNLIKTLYADDPSQGSGHTSKGFFFPLSDNYPISSNGTHTPQAPYLGFRSVVVSGVKSNRIKFTRGSAVDPGGNVYNWSAQIGTNVTGSATEYYFYY